MPAPVLGFDFGTSNSALALAANGAVRRIPVEGAADTLPTAVFFPTGGPMLIGAAAGEALIDGEEGRYLRALKSVLGAPLFHEERRLGGKRRSLADVATAFIDETKARAEAAAGQTFSRALSGRPVRFHHDPARDARAEADLTACYRAAGFEEVRFMPEPEAAARAAAAGPEAAALPVGALGLVVDIGGGTSDFSLFRRGADGRVEILASHGIRLGGADFDRALSLAHAMPLLGHGGALRREMGPGLLPVPAAIYADLSTWAKIPFLYTPEVRAEAKRMAQLAEDPAAMARLRVVLEDELGHALAFAVEDAKIAANSETCAAAIRMGLVERGLSVPLCVDAVEATLAEARAALQQAAAETLARAGAAPGDVAAAVLVGGSSLMGLVGAATAAACPGATQLRGGAFTAIVDGLALAAEEAFGD